MQVILWEISTEEYTLAFRPPYRMRVKIRKHFGDLRLFLALLHWAHCPWHHCQPWAQGPFTAESLRSNPPVFYSSWIGPMFWGRSQTLHLFELGNSERKVWINDICKRNYWGKDHQLINAKKNVNSTIEEGLWAAKLPEILGMRLRSLLLFLSLKLYLQGIQENEPIKNRYVSKSNYCWKMINISFESELLKFFDSVLLFIVRYKLRQWKGTNTPCPKTMMTKSW